MAKRPASFNSSAAGAQKPARRRGAGMRHIAPAAAAAARPALRKRGLAVAGVLVDWHKIVGPFLAEATAPEKLAPGRALPEGGRDAGVLHLRVGSPALAPEIAHLAPQIIEKVNGYFGYRAVARLNILHAPVSRADDRAPPAPRDAAPEEKESVARQTAGVEDDGLRDALRRLGEAVAVRRDRG
ncbi:MAG: DciA family protein [Rhodospirillaceae bacterium]|nr:DciA family protein [Rhodospirillaceae bacterium]